MDGRRSRSVETTSTTRQSSRPASKGSVDAEDDDEEEGCVSSKQKVRRIVELLRVSAATQECSISTMRRRRARTQFVLMRLSRGTSLALHRLLVCRRDKADLFHFGPLIRRRQSRRGKGHDAVLWRPDRGLQSVDSRL